MSFLTRNSIFAETYIKNPNIYDLEKGQKCIVYDDKIVQAIDYKEPLFWEGEIDLILNTPVKSILVRNNERSSYVSLNQIERVFIKGK